MHDWISHTLRRKATYHVSVLIRTDESIRSADIS